MTTPIRRSCTKQSGLPNDPIEVPIQEVDLFRYQRYRWLDDDAKSQAVRYREFNVHALLRVAAELVDQQGLTCSKIRKRVEGQYNKAFVLTMSNGREVVARLPIPMQDQRSIPLLPKWRRATLVLASSSDATNAVGAEFIIEEKVPGHPLGGLWAQMPTPAQLGIIDQLIDVEKKLASVSFTKHGTSLLEYALAIGETELQWAESYAVPRINSHRSIEEPETSEQYIQLLQQYLEIAPYLLSGLQESTLRNTLSHSDLHLDNIFIDPTTNQITAIIDWQSAAVAPLALQPFHPQMPELSLNPASDEQPQQEESLLDYYYQKAKAAGLPRRPSQDLYFRVRISPMTHITGYWERHDLFFLRQSLISVIAGDNFYPIGTLCPITLTREKLQAHRRESDLISGIAGIIRQLNEQGHIPIGEMVPAEQYDNARALSEYFKREFMDLAEDDEKRALHEAIWPY
ncbi:kinase-like domain-containing protein [Aspergillus multicolor]|uniref:phosphotransferase family protein n=1 Tax=Aspergillus multicolor TaxID=41759 RepID=UPI003CCE0EB4